MCRSIDRPFNIVRGPRKETLTVAQVAGVVAVCSGIIALRRSGGRALPRKGLVLALALLVAACAPGDDPAKSVMLASSLTMLCDRAVEGAEGQAAAHEDRVGQLARLVDHGAQPLLLPERADPADDVAGDPLRRDAGDENPRLAVRPAAISKKRRAWRARPSGMASPIPTTCSAKRR